MVSSKLERKPDWFSAFERHSMSHRKFESDEKFNEFDQLNNLELQIKADDSTNGEEILELVLLVMLVVILLALCVLRYKKQVRQSVTIFYIIGFYFRY